MINLHSAGHRRGVVAAPHHAAAEAGRMVLAEGGNALEVMIAMGAAIAVVYPHMNHLGSDGFWLFREPRGRMRAFMAGGPAGARATFALYREAGHETIPVSGPLAALTIPGAVGGWMLAYEAAKKFGGKLPLSMLLEPAIILAREGFAVTRGQHRAAVKKSAELKAVPGFAQFFLTDDKPPDEGANFKQIIFSQTLDQLARAGLQDFYRGDIAREMAADLEQAGCPVTRADFESYKAYEAEPLSLQMQSGVVYNTPPPTPGLISLVMHGLIERLKPQGEGFDFVHGVLEATKRGYSLRDRFITDPRYVEPGMEKMLSPDFLDKQVNQIDRAKVSPSSEITRDGDTVWMGAADSSGIAVSYIQSIFEEFGSGVVLPRTGVLMQNRGISFSLRDGAPNALAPGRVPPHTLCAALASLKDGRIMAYGTRGGDGQPQTQTAFFARHILFGQKLGEALDRPRWRWGQATGSTANIKVEPRLGEELIDRLTSAGHRLEVLPDAYAEVVGQAGAVILHPDGTLEGGHDPRADGGALGV